MRAAQTGSGSRPTIVSVTGGCDGLAASYDDTGLLADELDRLGDELRDDAGQVAAVLADPGLAATAVLSPLTWAAAEAALGRLAAGPGSLLEQATAWELDARGVRASLAALEAADRAAQAQVHALDLGLAVLTDGVGLLAGGGLLAQGALAGAVEPHLPPGEAALVASVLGVGRSTLLDALQTTAMEHPGAVEHLVDGELGLTALASGLLPGGAPLGVGLRSLLGGPDGVLTAAGVAAGLAPEGRPRVTRVERHLVGDHRAPTSVADLVGHLARVNAMARRDPDLEGTIEVQTFRGPDGRLRHVVYVPGTDDMTTPPWEADSTARDMDANVHLMAGRPTAYTAGVLAALRRAHVAPGEPVALVGHSQGGMAAAALLARQHRYTIPNAVTAGSPTAQVTSGYPPGTHVLSMENTSDAVPLLAGRPNPPSVEQTTVRVDAGGSGYVAAHDIRDRYRPAAVEVDASTDPAILEQLQSLRDNGFLTGHGPVTTQVYRVQRRVG